MGKSRVMFLSVNPLPDDKILDGCKVKADAGDKRDVTKKLNFFFLGGDECWLPTFSPFPTKCPIGFLYSDIQKS